MLEENNTSVTSAGCGEFFKGGVRKLRSDLIVNSEIVRADV